MSNQAKTPIEQHHHITLHVFLPSRPTPELSSKIAAMAAFKLDLEGAGCFENKDQDVLYIKVVMNDSLLALHKLLVAEYKVAWPHPEYKPHVTIAFLKPGKGKAYVEALKDFKATVLAKTVNFNEWSGDGDKPVDVIALRKNWKPEPCLPMLGNTEHLT